MTNFLTRLLANRYFPFKDLLLATLFAAAAILPMVSNHTPTGGWLGAPQGAAASSIAPVEGLDYDLPANCTAKPFLTDTVLAVPNDYYSPDLLTLTFAEALKESKAGQVWLVGYCK
jgi:hypothetical protein